MTYKSSHGTAVVSRNTINRSNANVSRYTL